MVSISHQGVLLLGLQNLSQMLACSQGDVCCILTAPTDNRSEVAPL
jgi:hypothetical protein